MNKGPRQEGVGEHIDDWAREMNRVQPDSAEFLDENRAQGFREVERLGLPRYVRQEVNLADFFVNKEQYFKDLERKKYFITLIPIQKDERRLSRWGIGREEVVDFVKKNIDAEKFHQYNLIIQEYFENLFGGNIIIGSEKNQIYVEFKTGSPSEIANGSTTPEFFIGQDEHTGSFRYSFEDEGLRRVMYQTLLSVPHEGQERDMLFLPGYYEFVIVKDDEGRVRPIFLDYKDKPVYQVAWKDSKLK